MDLLTNKNSASFEAFLAEQEAHRNRPQYIPISFALLDDPNFRNDFLVTKKYQVYMWLRRHIMRDTGYSTYKSWTENGDISVYYQLNKDKIIAALPIARLAKDLAFSESSVRRYIQQLKEENVIDLVILPACENQCSHDITVYILGVNKDGKESYFVDEVFGKSPKRRVPAWKN